MSEVKSGNWFIRHKIWTAIIILLIIAGIAGAAGGNKNTSSNNSSNSGSHNNQKQYRFTDRADKQPSDIEVLPGESATIDGVKMTLSNPQYTGSLSEFENADQGKIYLVADVSLENTSNHTQPYNVFDFRVQTVSGQVLDNAITSEPDLSSGDLVAGGKANGKIYFQVPVETGHEYVIWKPGIGSTRAIVQVKQ